MFEGIVIGSIATLILSAVAYVVITLMVRYYRFNRENSLEGETVYLITKKAPVEIQNDNK